MEASSRGCAVIISDRGGLPETITDGIILKHLTANDIYKNIKNLILNKKIYRYSKKSYKNFYLDDKFISSKIDNYRVNLFSNSNINIKKLRIPCNKF